MQLTVERTVLVLIDVQAKLTAVMQEQEALLKGLHKIVAGVQKLGIPVLWNEQNPERMGSTVESLRDLLLPAEPIPKMSFGCCGSAPFMEALRKTGRDQVLLAGIETHVCVFQTAVQLLDNGYHVQVVSDAVSSRTPLDREIGLKRLEHAASGRKSCLSPLTTAESALFELMQSAQHPHFRDILKIIR